MDYSNYVICLAAGENRLFESLREISQQMGINCAIEVTGLHVGDVMIGRLVNDEKDCEIDWDQSVVTDNLMNGHTLNGLKPMMLVERKTISDYCSSFRSQHYQNQKSRMMGFRQQTGCQCHLVVEGYRDAAEMGAKIGSIPISTLEQCFDSVRVRDHFFVKHVESTYFHADYLLKCIKTMEKYQLWKGVYCGQGENLRKDFVESLKARKKSNLTPAICYQLQLSTIPDISVNMAEKIAEVYPNLRSLIEAMVEEGEQALAEIKVGRNRLGKVRSARIYEFLDIRNVGLKSKSKISLSFKKK